MDINKKEISSNVNSAVNNAAPPVRFSIAIKMAPIVAYITAIVAIQVEPAIKKNEKNSTHQAIARTITVIRALNGFRSECSMVGDN